MIASWTIGQFVLLDPWFLLAAPVAVLAAVLGTLNQQIIQEVSAFLTQQVGPALVDVAEVAEGPALVELAPRVLREPGPGNRERVVLEWTVTLRAGQGGTKPTGRLRHGRSVEGDVAGALRRLYPQFPTVFRAQVVRRPGA